MRTSLLLPLCLVVALAASCEEQQKFPVGTLPCGESQCQADMQACCYRYESSSLIGCAPTGAADAGAIVEDRSDSGLPAEPVDAGPRPIYRRSDGGLECAQVFACQSPASCSGRACCLSQAKRAACAAGDVCEFLEETLCAAASDCPSFRPFCCPIILEGLTGYASCSSQPC